MMSKDDIKNVIEAIMPYVKINHAALLSALVEDPISGANGLSGSLFEYALCEVAERAISTGTSGILAEWDKRSIVQVTHKVSKSGNATWYCTCDDGKIVYVRQSNKDEMVALYPDFENMPIGSVTNDVSIEIYTVTDGNFLNIMNVAPNGVFNLQTETELERKARVVHDDIRILGKNTVYFDIETTGVDNSAEIVGVAVYSEQEGEYKTYVIPTDVHKLTVKGKGGKSASDINGITEDMLKDAPTFPDIHHQLVQLLRANIVVTYGDFDKRVLNQVCERHGLDTFDFINIDLMKIYGEWDGALSGRGGYKFHKLIDAYENLTGKVLANAHDAMSDTKAMVEIVEALKLDN